MDKQRFADGLRERIRVIIFEADTPAGRLFDLVLLCCIVASILVVAVESIPTYQQRYGDVLLAIEWGFTALFTLEYLLRLFSTPRPVRYMTSFFGVIDLLAILPAYLGILLSGGHGFMIVRALRILRIFRILKLGHFLKEGRQLMLALRASFTKISIFLLFILILVTILGGIMYLVEGGVNERFNSIPISIYWAIVTLTTVGYGDITPITPLGQFLSALVMILGYAIIAVPTGIVTGELINQSRQAAAITTRTCKHCTREGHDVDARFCKFCGTGL
jgi:voltage-gated potassium channel